jgi:glucans biosynthesis protein C
MMLLGIWYHASCFYAPLQFNWPYKDPSTSALFNVPLLLIHVFRMPIFFALAGFFARMSWERAGTQAFLRNRTVRILLPFVVGWPIVFAINTLGWAALTAQIPLPWQNWDFYSSGRVFSVVRLRTVHLWFLYYLIFFYPLFVSVALAARRYLPGWQAQLESVFRKLLSSSWRPLIFALPSCLPLFFMRTGTLETDDGFLIHPTTFLAYAIFFGFGWLLFRQNDLLPGFQRHAWRQVLAAIVISAIYFISIRRMLKLPPSEAFRPHMIAALSGSLITWLFFFGITGLFIRYLDRPNARIRYLADASYWMYLIHLPLLIWTTLAMRPLHLPAIPKFTVELAICVSILLASYEWLVRYTIIGRVLNGPRERMPSRSNISALASTGH